MARSLRPRPGPHPSGGPAQPLVPDRSLAPESTPTVAVRAAGHHPFIYRKMVIGPVGPDLPSAGDLVRAVDRDGRLLGYGLWNPRSQISLRLLTREAEP